MDKAIQWAVWFVLMSLIMGWLGRTRLRTQAVSGPKSLHHPRSVLLLGGVIACLFLAVAILSYVFPDDSPSLGISLSFAGFSLLGWALILEYVRVHHRLEPDGLEYGKLVGGRGNLRWNEVTNVRYSASAKWFRLTTINGKTVRISAMLMGLPEFAQLVLEKVDATRIEDSTRPILEQTAAGTPPSLWS